jgi:hypothetical protein
LPRYAQREIGNEPFTMTLESEAARLRSHSPWPGFRRRARRLSVRLTGL